MKKSLLSLLAVLANTLFLMAQSPGGVASGLKLWNMANKGVIGSAPITAWTDQTGINTFSITGAPQIKTAGVNFNPSVAFDGSSLFVGNTSLNHVDVFAVAKIVNSTGSNISGAVIAHSTAGALNYFFHTELNNLYIRQGGNSCGVTSTNTIPYTLMNADTSDTPIQTIKLNGLSKNGSTNTSSYIAIPLLGSRQVSSSDNLLNGSEIAEVIVYDTSKGTGTERSQIQSYLALKYGITLDQTTAQNYIASNGSTIYWDGTANSTYNKNIAGIVRDDMGGVANAGLVQKQSQSINSGSHPILGLSSVVATNSANTGSFSTNRQALVWGDNGLTGNTTFITTSSTGSTIYNNKLKTIWKVQNTANLNQAVQVLMPTSLAGSANANSVVLLYNTTDVTFTSGNQYIANTGTTTINSVNYYVFTIPASWVNNPSFYFTEAFLAAPGGVSNGLTFWAKSDASGTTPGSSMSKWADVSPYQNDILTVGSMILQPGNAAHNFQPWTTNYSSSNYFSVSDTYLAPAGSSIFSPLTIFGAARVTSASGESLLTGIDNETNNGIDPGFGLQPSSSVNYPFMWRFSNGILQRATNANMAATLSQSSVYLYQPPYNVSNSGTGNLLFGIDGFQQTFTGQNAASSLWGSYLKIGYNNYGTLNAFLGDIQEVIWYKSSLSPSEIAKVNSYLAIKYGTTLTAGTATDYVDSSGNPFWTGNATYQNNIGGIGRDDASGLYQKQSSSVNIAKKQVIFGLGTVAATNLANANTFTSDRQFFAWGDNNLTGGSAFTGTGINQRLNRVWYTKPSNGFNQATQLLVPTNMLSMYSNPTLVTNPSSSTFASGNTFKPLSTTTTVNGVSYYVVNLTAAEVSSSFFFTFAGFAIAPGGVVSNLTLWLRADKGTTPTTTGTITNWTDYAQGNDATAIGGVGTPSVIDGSLSLFNFNKAINFSANTQRLANISSTTIGTTNYDIFTYTQNGLSGTRLFNIGLNNTNFSGNNWDSPGIQTDATLAIRRVSDAALLYYTSLAPYSSTLPSITYNRFTDTSANRFFNGSTATTGTANYSSMGASQGGYVVGANNGTGLSGDDAGFTGNVGEFIVYNDNLSAADRLKVDSYLAIKYGQTLDQTVATSYKNSSNQTIWNSGTLSTFNKNIAGIARDDFSGLLQKQSKSINTGNQVIISTTTGNLPVTNNLNSTTITTDLQSLVWGDNGITTGTTSYVEMATGFTRLRNNRIFAVDNTGSYNQATQILYPVNGSQLNGPVQLMINPTSSTFTSGINTYISSTGVQVINSKAYYTFNVPATNVAQDFFFTLTLADTDTDGVPDVNDLDDDNDGILDTAENPCQKQDVSKSGVTISSSINWTNPLSTLIDGVDTANQTAINSTQTIAGQTVLQFDFPSAQVLNNIELSTFATDKIFITNSVVNIQGWNGTSWEDVVTNQTVADPTTGTVNGLQLAYKFPLPLNADSYTQYRILGVSGSVVNGMSVQELYFTSPCSFSSNDLDGDGIINSLDLDSDGDGCSDAIEGGSSFTSANLVTSSMPGGNSGGTFTGTGSPITQNLGNTVGSTGSTIGIPVIATSGQTVGDSQNSTISSQCLSSFCYKPAITLGTVLDSKHGITTLGRAGADSDNWPMVRKGAWTVLEAKTKGFVINRIATTTQVIGITDPVKGMIVYDVQADCLKINTDGTSTGWKCFNTQTCPN
ncbi:hypothetical protein [Chryseobacterium sp. EO14]|uniref:beta strand repeat-containing protein n=1 Tax=Chryseobacterium sp. EO14 TaxID=2950551 RepID=UPI00210EACAA|nr:hypothetical protein [Chryseobacterium sp. EO14]MCQ4142454.1 hypothetical protein [Chryseobacterium sp. EO14]